MLIACPECGNQVSDKAASCPQCGARVKPRPVGHWLVTALIWLFIIGTVLGIGLMLLQAFGLIPA